MEQLEYQDNQRTEIGELGLFPLIDHITAGFVAHRDSTVKGVGDDCAVLDYGGDHYTLVSTGTMVEDIHFNMTYTPLKHLGYKAVAIVISNIAAMNGEASHVEVSVVVSNRYSVEALAALYDGIRLCCERYDVDLVGGDTTTSLTGLTITVTAIGRVKKNAITYRKGAKLHDLVCVSGDLGSAYSGLLVLEREMVTYQADPNFKPDLESYDYVLERFLKPEPRFDIVRALSGKGIKPTAMIDVSDGLASDMLHICKQSGCGCEVYEERLPIDYQTTRVCSEMSKNMLPVSNALNGGGDYELLFTVDIKDYEKIKEIEGIHIIGHITDSGSEPVMVTPQNTTIHLVAQGWQSNE